MLRLGAEESSIQRLVTILNNSVAIQDKKATGEMNKVTEVRRLTMVEGEEEVESVEVSYVNPNRTMSTTSTQF